MRCIKGGRDLCVKLGLKTPGEEEGQARGLCVMWICVCVCDK